jgi:GNAT superfamily N-acetyltransferase
MLVETLTAGELIRDQAWWVLYTEAFPASEREPQEVILRSVTWDVGLAFRARHHGTTVGLATVHLLKRPPAVFLVYVAIADAFRGGGLGRQLVSTAWELAAERLKTDTAGAGGLIWEVDDPEDPSSEAETGKRQGRVRFFRRLGGEMLSRSYLQPPVDGVAPVPMRLMYRPAAGSPWPSPPEIEALVHAIYFEKYGSVNGISATVLSDLLRTDLRGPSQRE